MVLLYLVQDHTQDLKVFFVKILEISCQDLFKDLVRSSQDLVGMYIQDLGKIFIKDYKILSMFLLK